MKKIQYNGENLVCFTTEEFKKLQETIKAQRQSIEKFEQVIK